MNLKRVVVFYGWNSLILLLASCLLSSCKHAPALSTDFPEICFEGEVLTIFLNSCSMTGCHDGSSDNEYVLDNYIDISDAVISGKPYKSPAYRAIISTAGERRMPPDRPLSLENRTIIRLWIEQGARLTSCPDTTSQPPGYVNPLACFSRDILPSLVSGCAMTGCHDAVTHKEGYTFTGYSTTLRAVKPGDPTGSKLYKVISAPDNEDDRMPPLPFDRIPSAVIDSIKAWIKYGAPDEFCGEVCDTVNPVSFLNTIWPTIQASCKGCHSGTNPGGGIRLENYTDIAAIAASGVLMDALEGNGVPKMPPAGNLSTCKFRQFGIWINNGYPNN